MAFDPTPYDDIEYAKGDLVPAALQLHIPGRDGKLRSVLLCTENVEAYWAAVEPFANAGKPTGLNLPPIPPASRLTDLIMSAPRMKSGGKKSGTKPHPEGEANGKPVAGKPAASDPPVVSDPPFDEPFWEVRNLGDGKVVPLKFWQAPTGTPWKTQLILKEFKRRIRELGGDEPNKHGRIREDVAYRWGREHYDEIIGTGLW